ncbi:hypothetical protein PYW08_001874 [Mythimna loreyi]|uniref:Uncharacterized protein n=2 Tax=Mythimna loreyi TaxID=667449 RepID=A0ACC2QH06_9NEOP|nr:hypothetical protein PYW08_013578 [Mythimna loreyi]KAJ8733576.1 hypothetical protein PYW08_001874 [Mythimna loreyi]
MSKCDNCKKSITKASPGLECSKCERIVHLNPKCTGLTNKQIAALKAASSLEWTCNECQQESPRRNSSIITPYDDDEDDETPVQINAKKLLTNISKEVEKAIKREMTQVSDSLQFHSAKLDEAVECIESFKKTIKALERRNMELINKNNNLETRVGALEQRLQEMEQEKLGRFVEIANVPKQKDENVKLLVNKIALHLKQSTEDIKSARRLYGRNDQSTNILVELNDEKIPGNWINAAKNIKPTVVQVLSNELNNNNTIYVREAMTKHHKHLFWNAKQELKVNHNYKYVWFKQGLVKARKDDGDKICTLRSMNDIHQLINNQD